MPETNGTNGTNETNGKNGKNDEWTSWIEDAISKGHITHYEYNHFKDIQIIGKGTFGKVYRTKRKNSEQYLALKSFTNLDNNVIKELVREIQLQRKVAHNNSNIIAFYGIAFSDQGNQDQNYNKAKKYLLVMEYADGGTLREYLENNFDNLSWENKYDLAYQLTCAVSCLHDEDIVHGDLRPRNILVNQNKIKLAGFGLSKRIEEASKRKSEIFGVVPYIDPKKFIVQKYSSTEKSDVYSVGILLWEISSGKPPFEGESYDASLAVRICTQGQRETIIPGTPIDYFNLYTECWNEEPDNRPDIHDVVKRLKTQQQNRNITLSNGGDLLLPSTTSNGNDNNNILTELHSKTSNGNDNNLTELPSTTSIPSTTPNGSDNNILIESLSTISNGNDYNDILIELPSTTSNGSYNNDIFVESPSTTSNGNGNNIISAENMVIKEIMKKAIKGEVWDAKRDIISYLNNHNIDSKEFYNLILNNSDSNSIFLTGFFNFHGIETKLDKKKAFKLFLNDISTSEEEKKEEKNYNQNNHALSQFLVATCYLEGHGTKKDEKLAFEYSKKVADKDYAFGQFFVGFCYEYGKGIDQDIEMAFHWYEKAANHGNITAMYRIACMYEYGKGTVQDLDKAIHWCKKSADQGIQEAIFKLVDLNGQ